MIEKPIIHNTFDILGRNYIPENLAIDSTDIGKQLGIITHTQNGIKFINEIDFTTDPPVSLYRSSRIFEIKGIHSLNYVARENDTRVTGETKGYLVYSTDNNDERDKAIVEKMDKKLRDRIAEAQRKLEEERQYILDNPWPNRVVFNGESYTSPRDYGSIWIENIDELLGTTTSKVIIPQGAFPKDYRWAEGASIYEPGLGIYTIKGIDPKYCIALSSVKKNPDGLIALIYTNDKIHNSEINKKVKAMAKDVADKTEAIRNMMSHFRQNGYSDNAAELLAEAKLHFSKNVRPNASLNITSIWLEVAEAPDYKYGAIPEGALEICFEPKKSVRFYRKENDKYIPDNRPLRSIDDWDLNKIRSTLIDDDVIINNRRGSVFDNIQKGRAESVTFIYDNGKSLTKPIQAMPLRSYPILSGLPEKFLNMKNDLKVKTDVSWD